MVFAPIISAEFLPYLEDRIQAFLRVSSDLYTSASVSPTLHYLVHYPQII